MSPRSPFTKLRRHAGQVIFHLLNLGSVKVSFCWKVKCMADAFGCVAGWQLQVAAPCWHGRLGKGIVSLWMSAKGPIPSPSGPTFPTAGTQNHHEACFSDGPPPSDNFFGVGRLAVNLNEVCKSETFRRKNTPPSLGGQVPDRGRQRDVGGQRHRLAREILKARPWRVDDDPFCAGRPSRKIASLCRFTPIFSRPAGKWPRNAHLPARTVPCNTVSSRQRFLKWQPVGESNPSYLVENQVS